VIVLDTLTGSVLKSYKNLVFDRMVAREFLIDSYSNVYMPLQSAGGFWKIIKFSMISTTPFAPSFDLIINSPATLSGMASTMIFTILEGYMYVGGHLVDSGNSNKHLSIFKINSLGSIIDYFGYTVTTASYY
jgi:hypothetical protein